MMTSPKITVVGSFAVGMTIRTPQLPIFGETLIGGDFDMGAGGKGSNQAIGTARLGAQSSLVAIIGEDKLAEIALDLYAAEGIDAKYLRQTADSPTGVGFIILNPRGENFIILDMGANNLMDASYVDLAEPQIASSDVVMAVLEIPVSAAARGVELGRKHGAITILNPAPAQRLPPEIFQFIDYLTPNESELRILLGLAPDDSTPTRELAGQLRGLGVKNVVVTMGSQGVLVLTDTVDEFMPAFKVEVVDTTGAGDSFNSGLAVALGEGQPLLEAVRFGAACGALACTRLGVIPSLARRDAVEQLLLQQPLASKF
ncbi:MAG: ribokinase [Chloroflexi bacterium OLB15]|nr:MAG: ribokinase [Chloroflexi bacterium OLB15]